MSDITRVHDGQIILKVIGGCFIPNGHTVSAYIIKKFKERQCASGFTWRHVDQNLKDFYYHEFLKKYIWEPEHKAEFKKTWNKYCQKLYKNLLYNWRKKGTRPSYIPDEIWNAWNNIWATEKWKQNSSIAQNNRNTEVGGPSTRSKKHTAGSRSNVEHTIDLVVGGRKKNSLYGLGSRTKVVYDRLMAPKLRGRSSFSISEVQALRQENQELRDQMKELKQSLEDRITALEQSLEDRIKTAVERQMHEFLWIFVEQQMFLMLDAEESIAA